MAHRNSICHGLQRMTYLKDRKKSSKGGSGDSSGSDEEQRMAKPSVLAGFSVRY